MSAIGQGHRPDLFTHQTWREFPSAGAAATGFRENRWRTVRSVRPDDRLLCYLTGVSPWVGLLEATRPGFFGESPIWSAATSPPRVPVRLVVRFEPETAAPVSGVRDQLGRFRDLDSPHAWTGWFRGSPSRWPADYGAAVA